MIKVSSLPVQVTKADLDKLFSKYGTIQITEESVIIEIGETESTAYVKLDKNESDAIKEQLENFEGIEQAVRGHILDHVGPEIGEFFVKQQAATELGAAVRSKASLATSKSQKSKLNSKQHFSSRGLSWL